jgi:hypothetical protein
MYSNENISMKLFRRRRSTTTTTSDVGESLCSDDLEWDKSDVTRHLPESDALSSYDINEMAEILRHRFLEFDMSSQIEEYSTRSRQSTISDIYSPISNQTNKCRFHRSLSDFNLLKQRKKSFLLSKHLSLMDIQSTLLKPRQIILTEENSRRSICSIPQSMEIEPEGQLFNTITMNNFLRLSKLEIIRLYLTKIREKFSSFVFDTFQSTKIPIITEEIIETYDIIEG